MGEAFCNGLVVPTQGPEDISKLAYASWLLNIQLVKHMLAMGSLTRGLALAIIDDAAASRSWYPIVESNQMKPAWHLICEMLGLPSDQFEDDAAEEATKGESA
jgi:hypothetical protein